MPLPSVLPSVDHVLRWNVELLSMLQPSMLDVLILMVCAASCPAVAMMADATIANKRFILSNYKLRITNYCLADGNPREPSAETETGIPESMKNTFKQF